MKDCRHRQIKNLVELESDLAVESQEMVDFFREVKNKIGDNKMVRDFWNLLVVHEKYNKRTLGVFNEIDPSGFVNWAGITFSALLAQNILSNAGYSTMGVVADMVALGFDGVLFANVFYNQPKARRIEEVIDFMQIKEPELYDIALVYNGRTRADIDTSEYDGKAQYQELNKKWLEEEKYFEKLAKEINKSAKEINKAKAKVDEAEEKMNELLNN